MMQKLTTNQDIKYKKASWYGIEDKPNQLK